MAFLVDSHLESGITVQKSYARIEDIVGNKDKLVIYIYYFVSAEASSNNVPSFKQSVHEFVPSVLENSLRWDKQGYEYLKTLPEFSDAIDVLE